MTAGRLPITFALLLAVVPASQAQTHELRETTKSGDCFRLQLDMKLTGEMRFFRDDGKTVTVKLNATAGHSFPERVLAVDGAQVTKSARVYESAKAVIERGKDRTETTLRPSRKLVVAQRHKGIPLSYSPAGALTRSELELISEHFDTLTLAGLLPGKSVKVGDTWPVPLVTAKALTGIADMAENKLTVKFEKVSGDEATISVKGTGAGVWQGAQLKTSVEATAIFDLKAKRLTKLVWKQKDDRDQGPVNPASSMTVTNTVTRKQIERPAALDDVAVVSVPEGFSPPGPMTNLEFRDAKDRYSLIHTRDWILTSVSANHAVLRLMDSGVWVAQVTVTPWTKAKKGEHLTSEQFKEAMNNTSGWRPERELQAGVIKSDGDNWTYRLSVQGQLNGVSVLQNFYLVAAPSGEQVVLAFTLAPKMAEKLGARDLSMAASIEVPAKK